MSVITILLGIIFIVVFFSGILGNDESMLKFSSLIIFLFGISGCLMYYTNTHEMINTYEIISSSNLGNSVIEIRISECNPIKFDFDKCYVKDQLLITKKNIKYVKNGLDKEKK